MTADQNSSENMGEIDFKSLILGLSGVALHHLGETKASEGQPDLVNFPLARQNIEIIAMLAEKTKGNLTSEEEGMIQQVLLDLRMRFIECTKRRKS